MGFHIRYHHIFINVFLFSLGNLSTPFSQPNLIHPLGPYGANIFDSRSWGDSSDPEEINFITLEITHVILAIGVFVVGVELPIANMMKHWKGFILLTHTRRDLGLFHFSF